MNIEASLLEEMQLSHFVVLQRYFSRRNAVYRVLGQRRQDGKEFEFIYKEYVSGNCEREYVHLNFLQGLSVPAVFAKGNTALCLEYIEGPTLLDRLEAAEQQNLPFYNDIDLLIDFLQKFYTALPGHCYGDVNLRNFIKTPTGLYGIDLEETRQGQAQIDIGKAAAFLLTYSPEKTPYKIDAADYLIRSSAQRLHLLQADIVQEMDQELAAMKQRRKSSEEAVHEVDQKDKL